MPCVLVPLYLEDWGCRSLQHVALCRGQRLPSAAWAPRQSLALLLMKAQLLPREEERVLCSAAVLAMNPQPGAAYPSWPAFMPQPTRSPSLGLVMWGAP